MASDAAGHTSESKANCQLLLLAQHSHLISEFAHAIDNQFNNMMMAVTSYAELELRKASPAARRNLEQILRNATRATYLGQKLLALGRHTTSSPKSLSVNEVITPMQDLLQEIVGEHIELCVNLMPDLPNIAVDPVEIEQVLFGIAVHTRTVLCGKGKLFLSTKRPDVVESPRGYHETPAQVVLLVSDSTITEPQPLWDVNLDEQALNANLTLALIAGVAKRAKGSVRAAVESQAGLHLAIYFPAEIACSGQAGLPGNLAIATRTLLIVEDDDAVRIPSVEFLKMEGFKVLQAKSGPEAINTITQNRSSLDLLITDILMPGMNGHELAATLQEAHSNLKVLYMSGDTSEACNALQSSHVLQKPFRLEALKQRVQSLLNSESGVSANSKTDRVRG